MRRLCLLGFEELPCPLTWQQRLQIATDVASALVHLHTSVLSLHHDIKPSNILLDGNTRAVLADFGLSRAMQASGELASTRTTRLSTTIGLKGTQGFLDPQVVNGKPYDQSSDGYAYGLCLLMLLTGLDAFGLVDKCRNLVRYPTQPDRWAHSSGWSGGVDSSAGQWPQELQGELAEVTSGLLQTFQDERMSMSDALARLMSALQTFVSDRATASSALPPEEARTRLCMICLDAPREMRYRCGHSCVCFACNTRQLGDAQRWREVADDPQRIRHEREQARAKAVVKCLICSTPVGDDVAECGAQVATAPTFIMTPPQGRGGRGARGGRGGRGV